MPWGVAAGVVGSVAGAAVSGAMAPSTSGGSGGASYYIPTGLQSADSAWQDLLGQQNGAQSSISQLMPWYQQSLNQGGAANAMYGGQYQTAGNLAGQQYGNLATTLSNQSAGNFGTQQSLLNAGQQVYQNALDPQSALYNRSVQQLEDQTGATNSMYGLGSSAAGAGVANQALSNFGIDWNAQQLQNQIAGLGAYAGAANTAGSYGQLGTAQAQAAPGYTLQSGQVPFQTGQTLAGVPGQLAGQYASGIESGPLSSASSINGQIIPYLNYGTGAQAIPYQQQAQGAGAAGALTSQGISQGIQGVGNAVQNAGGWGNLFSGTTGSFGGGDFSGAFTSSPYYSGGGNSYGFTM